MASLSPGARALMTTSVVLITTTTATSGLATDTLVSGCVSVIGTDWPTATVIGTTTSCCPTATAGAALTAATTSAQRRCVVTGPNPRSSRTAGSVAGMPCRRGTPGPSPNRDSDAARPAAAAWAR